MYTCILVYHSMFSDLVLSRTERRVRLARTQLRSLKVVSTFLDNLAIFVQGFDDLQNS